ncbi:MAG: outer membrane beta-barrel protein [Flavobacteriales bacterium]
MIGRILLFLCLLIPGLLNAQGLFSYFKLTADDSRYERFDRLAVDLNYDNWDNMPNGVNSRLVSLGVNAYFYKDIPFSRYSNMAFAIGLGISSHNVHHNSEIVYRISPEGNSYTAFEPYPDGYKYRKNKLSTSYLEVPVEFRFRTKYKKDDTPYKLRFRFYPGFKAGYLLSSHVKLKDADTKVKIYNINNLMQYRYGPTLRLTFHRLSVYGFYSLTPLFTEGRGDEVYQYSLGLSLMIF